MAITVSGGAAIGTALPAATVKAQGEQRVQFDTTGTYAVGGIPSWTTFIKTILGSHITPIAMNMAMPGGAFYFYWDKTNDTLRIYVAATGVEVAAGVAVTLTNAEIDVRYQ